jgi:3-oxoacyl-[acyl-carrier-protein] synthase-3
MSLLKVSDPIYLLGPEHHLPEREVTNEDLVEWMGAGRASWIEKRTGIQKRHWAQENESCSDLAVKAGEKLFSSFAIEREKIKHLVLTTVSGDYPTPPTSPLVQDRLKLKDVGAFDLGAACAGFATGLHVCAGLVGATHSDHLLLSSEIRSKFLSKEDFATAVLFGDGASAVVISQIKSKAAKFRFHASQLFSDGKVATVINIAAGGSRLPYHQSSDHKQGFLHMEDSASLFLKAAEGMSEAATQFLKNLGIAQEKIAWVVPHQANLLLVRDIARRMNLPGEKVFETIQHTGNTSGASVGIALSMLAQKNVLKSGEFILLLSAGGGGLAACCLLEFL